MTSASAAPKSTHLAVNDWEPNLRSVCDWLAPTWALDQWIAVNPFWGLKHLPASRADALLRQHGGFSIVMPAEFYLEAWEGGRIREEDLLASLNESASTESPEQLLGWLKNSHANVERSFGSVIDSFPPVEEDQAAIEAVCAQIAGTCAAFFDQHQAGWSGSVANQNLYRFWLDSTRDNVLLDANTGVSGARSCLQTLPANLDEAIERAVSMLGLCPEELQAIAHSWLLRVNGWAAWCRGEDWRAQLEARSSDRVWELLGIALAWETIGLQCAPASRKATYLKQRTAMARSQTAALADKRWVWHRAFEIRYQQTLWQSLATAPHHDAHHESPPAVQAVFCIDVRSEVMRRHLETSYPQVRTLGFAGFFGLAVEHQEHGPKLPVRRLPGLLPAPYRFVSNSGSLRSDHQINRRLDQREITRSSVRKAKYSSLSTFTLVETTGLAWGWKLIRDSLKKTASDGSVPECDGRLVHKTTGDPLTDAEKADLVAGMLRGMSLTSDFAPLVVFVGHGSHTNNNPNQAGLDCGACGGQSGAVNASLAARLFNEPSVRALLAKRDIPVPDSTWAVAAEHCTLTDTVNWLDTERVPDSHLSGLAKLQAGFVQAGIAVRRERASALGLNGLDDDALLAMLKQRGRDWSEVRPEWGLANNAAIVFARRELTRSVDLGGRVFLHEYDPDMDPNGDILESLLSAPMVVANWINLQYFASVTSPQTYGSGNKLLHSVIGGKLGVIEGNDPQLRIGLPLQSVHDGQHWRHEPVRLTVLIDAPRHRIERVLQQRSEVAALAENQWLFLYRHTGNGVECYREGAWHSPTGGNGSGS